jgi:hypothetical protein
MSSVDAVGRGELNAVRVQGCAVSSKFEGEREKLGGALVLRALIGGEHKRDAAETKGKGKGGKELTYW